ncbi:MAG: hypothetical protein JWM91_3765 [Rhodospirillales bacterium]|nr:hypothetical protein [Rhodospirillales bacterium]
MSGVRRSPPIEMDSAQENDDNAHARVPSRCRRFSLSLRARRVAALLGIVAIVILGYGTLRTHVDVSDRPAEQRFGTAEAGDRVELYVERIAINPGNDSMKMRISAMPSGATSSEAAPHKATQDGSQFVPGRDLVLIVRHENQTEQIQMAGNHAYPEATFAFDLNDGAIHDCLFDRYTSQINLSCFEARSNIAVPIRITSWEGMLGFTAGIRQIATPQDKAIQLDFAISRTGRSSFLASPPTAR